ncbi:MAG: hypothetical protein ACQEQO_01040 [Thermodesulfobacteriota bacterium]
MAKDKNDSKDKDKNRDEDLLEFEFDEDFFDNKEEAKEKESENEEEFIDLTDVVEEGNAPELSEEDIDLLSEEDESEEEAAISAGEKDVKEDLFSEKSEVNEVIDKSFEEESLDFEHASAHEEGGERLVGEKTVVEEPPTQDFRGEPEEIGEPEEEINWDEELGEFEEVPPVEEEKPVQETKEEPEDIIEPEKENNLFEGIEAIGDEEGTEQLEEPFVEEKAEKKKVAEEGTVQEGFPSISEEKIEAIVTKVVSDVLERVVREIMPEVAEKIIREEIDALKTSIMSED